MMSLLIKRILHQGIFTAGFCCALSFAAQAQSPPGPMTQTTAPPPAAATSTAATAKTEPAPDVPRKKDLTGAWKLNKDESTSPRDKDHSGRGGNGGGRSGGGYPGGGHGGYGGGMHRGGMSDDERKEMQELMRPSETLEFTQDGPAIKMTDDYDRHRTFYTDGRKVKKSKDADNQEFDATWNEYRLVSDFKGPDGNKIERTFEVLEGNQQLRETIHFTMGRSQREVYLRHVYDLSSAANSPTK
ncbi:MAG TPA: hypothetical protein VN025_01025 [Candidatus Dormibacteraeota bacterium]|jgi:hypothetical protein|nr:hypothetical protein [Candidatus Dormibacteraeota bacterium]